VPGLTNEVISAKLLTSNAAIKTQASAEGLVINVPAKAPDAIATVIKVQVKGAVKAY